MERFAWENPPYVQYEFYCKHDLERKKIELRDGPSAVITVDSSSSSFDYSSNSSSLVDGFD